MGDDEIIKEVRVVREAYGQKFGFDVAAIFRDAKSRERGRDHEIVALEPKPAEPVTADSGESKREDR